MSGLRAWMVQRASAVYMLFFIVFLLAHFLVDPPHSYLAWRDWVTSPGLGVGASVFCAALLAHAWVGLRDVILDYVRPVALRLPALGLLGLVLAAIGAWLVRIL
ncbi:succinate dehydrogenase, hydrophobic membrane anchor protein [Variovorax sp. PBL-E5]|uniref:succinate dehydrogenase, hydrophobic membrane anchor protein n=1 Tax=Variovorax sp. PBL-E5 TaxID=434014 RepID=UPI00131973FB|nr:succinate dehydrogenase, hydrophobic membrane anchor protein [Variovorax sp. PBL-E5]VTU21875.1 Succinate dehydrogenase hydrophobic membrane anchor subunit [Variovorax sp. PBL-E5]